MIHKKQIADLIKRVSKQERGIHDAKMMHPGREWIFGLGVGVLIFISSALWSVYSYVGNRDVSGSLTDQTSPEQSLYREAQVKEALKQISEREKKFTNSSSTVPVLEDSIVASTTVEESPIKEIEVLPAVIPTETIPTTTDDFNIILN